MSVPFLGEHLPRIRREKGRCAKNPPEQDDTEQDGISISKSTGLPASPALESRDFPLEDGHHGILAGHCEVIPRSFFHDFPASASQYRIPRQEDSLRPSFQLPERRDPIGSFQTWPPPTIPAGDQFPIITVQCILPIRDIEALPMNKFQVCLALLDVGPEDSISGFCKHFLGSCRTALVKDFDEKTFTTIWTFPSFKVHEMGHYRLYFHLKYTNGPTVCSIWSTQFSVSSKFTGFGDLTVSYLSHSIKSIARGFASLVRAIERDSQTQEAPEKVTPTDSMCTILVANLDLPNFVESELATVEALRSVLTVSGTPERAFAADCQEYIRTFWPTAGPRVLRSLIASMHAREENIGISSDFPEDVSSGSFVVSTGGKLIVAAKGSRTFMEDLIGLLRWLTATFQPCRDGKFQLSESTIRETEVSGYIEIFSRCTGELTGSVAAPWSGRNALESTATCWYQMFAGFNLAVGFPIPGRDDMEGVELPFQAMKLLGLIWYPCHYDGKMFLKGDQTALLPVASTSDNCIQWHFVQTDDEDSQALWGLIKRFGEAMTDLSQTRDLSSKRMFVGYWPNAEIHLGTRDSGFRSVELSGAEYNDKNKIIMGDEVTGTTGTSGMGFFTAEVSATVLLRQDANQRIMAAHKRIHDKIRNAKKVSTLIYDVGTKRGWLVPELSVVLHMILAWASYQDQAGDILERFPYAMPHYHGGEAAYEAIQSAMASELPAGIQTDETKTFSHLLVEFFVRISHVKDQRRGTRSRETKDLVGYEFREISEFQENIASKRATIDAAKSAGWPKLLASKPDIAVLFCSNLADPIRPTFQGPDHCLNWNEIPPEQYFLTASLPCVRQLSHQCGGGEFLKVYNNLYCVPGNESSWTVKSLCTQGHSPCYQSLFEMSSHPPKETHAYSENGAIVIGKLQTRSLRIKFGKGKLSSSLGLRRIIGIWHDERPVSTKRQANTPISRSLWDNSFFSVD